MSLTVLQKINIAKLSLTYASVDILQSGLYGGGIDLNLPRKLYCIRKNVEWLYDLDNADTTLTTTSNYLLALCGKYYLKANNNIGGSGGSVSPVNPGSSGGIYPFIITSADFQQDGVSYNNPKIIGDNLTIFVNEYSQQWLTASANTFSYTLTGIVINIPSFDANTQSWTIMIQKLNS